ncbi:DUF3857 domain-containing transglutaminase family protein [Aestuariibaculum suncheonense]|uniref:DUF3857 and transglutaminase domain-containing protein n=1 Tax=Aestuariibaculum suncheonense TaxID=1028745 RepID=A0A8J6Q9C7_9FLAO|nr:DUF3857 and transglutaminase domain-containing protein [Aestuariibaculum suncheonense]MBD0836152.1 DUF3857 and transglutaminase domain-containing protein [Aestuariibaculum suncheonense]
MAVKNYLQLSFFFISFILFSQEKAFTSFNIPEALSEGANAVVRLDETHIVLEKIDAMQVLQKCIITVLNKSGDGSVNAYVHYDDNVKIKALEATIYNKVGAVIKKIKEKNFKDVSAVDGGTLYSDSRVKYLDYTPSDYPYTIEFVCEILTSNTAFIPSFMPIDEYFVSVEESKYSLTYPENITVRKKEKNLEGLGFEKQENSGLISYSIKNLKAYKPEDFCPSLVDIAPRVLVASKQFSLEGVQAEVEDWNGFGRWMYNDLLFDTVDLPASTISKVQELVKNETSDIEKAKKIYQYVQDKVRYISVQVGIGGWKPFKASKVDELGYGDCKGLTNYTMALLKAVGVESNYCVIYAGKSQRNMEPDFALMQGNHVILSIPTEEDAVWLECTSQELPFGFIGDFTDDRDVLVVTSEGGEIKHTKKYNTQENTQYLKGDYIINADGSINAEVQIVSKGIQYDDKYGVKTLSERDLDVYYKDRWGYLNTISINKIEVENDKTDISLTEHISFYVPNYTKKAGDIMLLTVNALNRNSHIPDKYKERNYPIKVKRGFVDEDEVKITLPEGYLVEALPEKVSIENKFGSYQIEFVVKDEGVIYKRKLIMNDGEFPKEDYNDFRDFYIDISKYDNAKIALVKNTTKN